MSGDNSQLNLLWAQLEQERKDFETEKARFEEERKEFELEREQSGLEQKIFVGNLDHDTNEEHLLGLFRPFGPTKEVIILRDRTEGTSKQSGFVKFYYKKSADAAVENFSQAKYKTQGGKELVVRYANLRSNAEMAKLKPVGGGPIPGVHPQSPYMYPPQNAYMNNNSHMQNSHSNPFPAVSSRGLAPGPGTGTGRGPPGANLYVNNIDPNMTEFDCKQLFEQYGNVLSVKLYPAQHYGFVSYEDPQCAASAIRYLHGRFEHGTNGSPLSVELKKDKGMGGVGGGMPANAFQFQRQGGMVVPQRYQPY